MTKNNLIVFILTIGVFSILNTEMGVIGILPIVASTYNIEISVAGLLVSLFALAVAVSGPILPLLLSKYNRKTIMIISLGTFFICNVISAFAGSFWLVLVARVVPAFLHPVYVSLSFAIASSSVAKQDAPKAVAKVMVGVSAGMVLGVPVMSYIANLFSLEIAMLAFALVNLIALALTIIYVPSMPVKEKMSYGSQLKILKDINLWWALIAVILLNGANFGVYGYLADYLERVSLLSTEFVSITLLIFGLANILGNVIAGRLLSQRPLSFVGIYPFLLTVLFLVMLFLGNMGFVIMGIVLIWGILVGCAANINQYWITRVASNVPDFANALFLVATNVGTCIAAFVCGIFIDEFGINNVVLGGILFTVLSIGFFFAGIKKSPKEKMLKVNKAV